MLDLFDIDTGWPKFQTRIQGKDGNGEDEWIRSHKTLKHCGSSVQPVYSILPDFSNRNYLILHEDYTNLDSTETKIKFLCKNIQLPSEVFVSMSSRPWLASPEQLVTVDTNETSTVNTWIKKIGSPHHLRNATSNI